MQIRWIKFIFYLTFLETFLNRRRLKKSKNLQYKIQELLYGVAILMDINNPP